jgi:hypothetical protein
VEVTLTDVHKYPLKRTYELNIEVVPHITTTKAIKDVAATGLTAEVKSISYTGIVKVAFSNSIIVPDDYKLISMQDIVITVTPGEDDNF